MKNKPPRILVYDIETTPLKAWTFRCGKQYVTHSSLDKSYNSYDIICITYAYNDGNGAKVLHWGFGADTSERLTAEFDKIIQQAQSTNTLIIGKNNKRFDDKHLNTHRWLNGQAPMPDWIKYTEDLEKQLRKYFYLPSMSLDYVSELRGLGGKIKMDFQDWISIVDFKKFKQLLMVTDVSDEMALLIFGKTIRTIERNGRIALRKMIEYGKKDSMDTLALIEDVASHCEFRSNVVPNREYLVCKDPLCGSTNVYKNGTRTQGGVVWQHYRCADHGGYAGKARILRDGTIADCLK